MNKKTVVVLSGGMDSTTLLYALLEKKHKVKAISFDYGQKHKKELRVAKETCKMLGVEHQVVKLNTFKGLLKSALTDKKHEIPEGHYADDVMKQTVVPNRNMIMLSIAIGYAISLGYRNVAYAAHAGDHAVYPDCRPAFVEAIGKLAEVVDYKPITILTPYLDITKTEVLKKGIDLDVDYSHTWSCYKGKKKACGKCGTCVERLEAFRENNLKDPIEYEV